LSHWYCVTMLRSIYIYILYFARMWNLNRKSCRIIESKLTSNGATAPGDREVNQGCPLIIGVPRSRKNSPMHSKATHILIGATLQLDIQFNSCYENKLVHIFCVHKP
jgi:hypothetical protein